MIYATATSGVILLPINSSTCASTGFYVPAKSVPKKRKVKKVKKTKSSYGRVVEP